jgi:hypothetical protein
MRFVITKVFQFFNRNENSMKTKFEKSNMAPAEIAYCLQNAVAKIKTPR